MKLVHTLTFPNYKLYHVISGPTRVNPPRFRTSTCDSTATPKRRLHERLLHRLPPLKLRGAQQLADLLVPGERSDQQRRLLVLVQRLWDVTLEPFHLV